MFYQFFKQLVGFSLSIFFNKIEILDKKNMPKKGPAILVLNHPNAVIDGVLIATKFNGQLSFIAAAEWFGKGIKNWIFREQFNMIPVYRPWIEKSIKKSNNNMFQDVTNSLIKGNRILIFPEGTSVTSDYTRELKTGTARMKLDYEKHSDTNEPLLIIPIGLNYSNPHKFYSKVTIKVGKPIEFNEYKEGIQNKEALQDLSKKLTDQIQIGMEGTMVNIRPDKNETLINESIGMLSQPSFEIKQNIAKNINSKIEDKAFEKFKIEISAFYESLKSTKLPMNFNEKYSVLMNLFTLVLLSPLYIIFGFIYGLPMLIAKFIFNKFLDDKIDTEYQSKKLNPSFRGTLVFLSGLAVLLVWLIIAYLIVGLVFKQWIFGLLIFVLTYPIIKVGLFIHHKLLNFIKQLKVGSIKKKRSKLVAELTAEKLNLIQYIKSDLLE